MCYLDCNAAMPAVRKRNEVGATTPIWMCNQIISQVGVRLESAMGVVHETPYPAAAEPGLQCIGTFRISGNLYDSAFHPPRACLACPPPAPTRCIILRHLRHLRHLRELDGVGEWMDRAMAKTNFTHGTYCRRRWCTRTRSARSRWSSRRPTTTASTTR